MTNQTPRRIPLDVLFGAAIGMVIFPAANLLVARTVLNGNQVFAVLLAVAFVMGRVRKRLMQTILNH